MSYAPLHKTDYELHERPYSSSLSSAYDRGSKGRTLLGLIFTLFSGVAFIASGIYLYVYSGSDNNTYGNDIIASMGVDWDPSSGKIIILPIGHSAHLAISLAINFAITLCTEVTGYVQGTTLKWALAREGQLRFNANLRLLRASGSAFSINGWVTNTLFSVSLIIAYASSSALIMSGNVASSDGQSEWDFTYVSFIPFILVGIIVLSQSVTGLVAISKTTVPTWSSSPLDVAAASLDSDLIQRRPHRCMRSVAQAEFFGTDPIRPSLQQPSAWESHKAVRRVVWVSWALIPGAVVWACIVVSTAMRAYGITAQSGLGSGYQVAWGGSVSPATSIFLSILVLGSIQSFLTMSLHCCELVVTLARDEGVWRAASSEKGARPAGNPVTTALGSWQSLGLLVGKPVFHWMFGNAAAIGDNGVMMKTPWILGLAAGVVPVAGFVTYIARSLPVGPQPAAYGHPQTLVDLVDDWSKTMYWGHKTDGHPAHAGTSTRRLRSVNMQVEYAGAFQM